MSEISLTQRLRFLQPAAVIQWPDDAIGRLDLTAANDRLKQVALSDELSFSQFIENEMRLQHCSMLVGGYLEHRLVYRRSAVFAGRSERSIHLGVDVWAKDGTPIYSPLSGVIHSFQDNNQFGDYGPTLILKHELDSGSQFYTLYGHLSQSDMAGWKVGKHVAQGEQIGTFGSYRENGCWPPHLHFQLMEDLEGLTGDYPGVCAPDALAHYQANCPDPNLLLRLPILTKKESTALF